MLSHGVSEPQILGETPSGANGTSSNHPTFSFGAPSASSASQNVESPTSRWLGLLLENRPLPDIDFESDGLPILRNSQTQTPHSTTAAPLRPISLAGIDIAVAPWNSRNPSLQERIPQLGSEQLFEKQAWYSPEALTLLPHEHQIFQHFVRHISQWVSDIPSEGCFDRTLQLRTKSYSWIYSNQRSLSLRLCLI